MSYKHSLPVIQFLGFPVDLYEITRTTMIACSNSDLSAELQKLYLQNKHWYSDVLFLEDETRFFQKISERMFSELIKDEWFEIMQLIRAGLCKLEERRNHLKKLITNQQHLLESVLQGNEIPIRLDLIDENTVINNEIKNLFISDRLIKNDLFTLVEEIICQEKEGYLLTGESNYNA